MVESATVQRQVNLAYSQAQLRSQGIQGIQQRALEQQQVQRQLAVEQQAQQQAIQVQPPVQDDSAAMEEAAKHIKKGYGKAYLKFMEKDSSPHVQAVKYYISKGLGEEQKSAASRDTGTYYYYERPTAEKEAKNILTGRYTGATEKEFDAGTSRVSLEPKTTSNLPSYISANVQRVIQQTGAVPSTGRLNINLPESARAISLKGISLPYQVRGTQIYTPEKGFTTPRTYVVSSSKPPTTIQDVQAVSNLPFVIGATAQQQIEQNFFPITIPEKKVEMPLLPYQKRGTLFSQGSSFVLPKGEVVTIPAQRTSIGREYGIGKVIGVGTPLAVYSLPVVGNIFLGASGISGTATALDTKATTQERILGGIEAGLSFGILGYKGYKAATKPYSYFIKQPTKSTFLEIQKPTPEGIMAKYTITQKVPPVIKVTQTPLGNFLGRYPVISAATKEQIYITKSQGWTKLGKPFKVVTGKVGSNKFTFTRIFGDTIPYEKETFAQLPKAEQYLWQTIAEKQTGIPVSLKNVPDVLAKNIDKVRGQVYTQDLFKMVIRKGKPVKVYFNNLGRTSSQFTTATVSKEISNEKFIKLPEYGFSISPEGRIVQSATFFKETSFPFARASGKVPELKGLTFILPGEEGAAESFAVQTSGIKSSPEYFKSLYQTPKQLTKFIAKVPSVKIPKVTPIITTTERVAPVLGKTTLTGLKTFTQVKPVEQLKISEGLKSIQLEKPATKTIDLTKGLTKVASFERVFEKTAQPSREVFKEATQIKQDTLQKQALKEITRTSTIQITPTLTTAIPKVPIKFKITEEEKRKRKTRLGLFKAKAYKVLVKRKGKFLEVGKNLPRGRALALGTKVARTTLARTFALKEAGTTELEDIGFVVPGREFRLPKRPTGFAESFVQKKALTRGSGEVGEILSFKRAKARRVKFL